MNPEDEKLETEQPTEGGKELELEEESTPDDSTSKEDTTSKDPLDSIDDVEELRDKAKGFRSASQRNKKLLDEAKTETPKKEVEVVTPTSEFLSKKDFYKANERKAIHSLTRADITDSDEVKTQKEYVTENWEKIRLLYAPRKGKETTEDIQDDLSDAIILFKAKNPPKAEDETSKLQETTGGGSVTPKSSKEETKDPPNYSIPRQPDTWYPDPKGKLKSD